MWIDAIATMLARRTSRRGLLARTAVVGAAVAMDPLNYILRPASAYSSVCGASASCSSGWTAFCVTINNGVNQCPPGSFAAGWWKADRASVCGGHARYYVDCNATCVNGKHGHYTCSCHCANTTTCDKRRVCCNQFRYGQCHQEIACYGPVVCRVISCVPPWEWAPCSRSSATDNQTLSHNAPALPHHYDAVEKRYVALRGHASPLGASVGGRASVADGLVQRYQQGLIAWSSATPAAVLTACAAPYLAVGGPASAFKFPTADERNTHDGRGRLARFTGGWIYSGGGHALHAFNGAWLSRWVALCDATSVTGRPTSNVVTGATGVGRIGLFERGVLAWTQTTGVHVVTGAVSNRYVTVGREKSVLGFPTSDTVGAPDGIGQLATFVNGIVVWSPETGAWDLEGAIAGYWSTAGATTSPLGYPISNAVTAAVPDAQVAHFQHGEVYSSGLGTFSVVAPVHDVYVQAGAEAGSYGLPVADATTDGAQVSQQFQNGTITV